MLWFTMIARITLGRVQLRSICTASLMIPVRCTTRMRMRGDKPRWVRSFECPRRSK